MAFTRPLEAVYNTQVDSIRQRCCPETIEKLGKEISRVARLTIMVEALNCIDGTRDTRDDDLLPAIRERRESLLVQIAEFDLQARLPLLSAGLYLGLPYIAYGYGRQLLPLYALNRSGTAVRYLGRKALGVASNDEEVIFSGSCEKSALATTGVSELEIPDGKMLAVDDYDTYVDGDCLLRWTGTFVVDGETKQFAAYGKGLIFENILLLEPVST